jgi:hypothetical protein
MIPNLIRLGACALCAGLLTPVAHADLTLIGHSSVASLGIPAIGQERLMFKGTKLRRDVIDRGRSYTYLYDPAAHQVAVLDHGLQQVELHGMKTLAGDTDSKFNSQQMKLSVTPTGRTQPLRHWTCAEHKLAIVMPAQLGTDPVTLSLTGSLWLARNVAEQAELAPMLKAAKSPDFFIGIPAFAKAAPAQAGALSEAFARIGPMGMVCSAEVEASYAGEGRMVELAKRLGTRLGLTIEQFNTDALPAEAFMVPTSYRVMQR